MTDYSNSRRQNFIDSFPPIGLAQEDNNINCRTKFNFSYFCKQESSQNFQDWDKPQTDKLHDKLKEYSKESLSYWQNQRCGSSGMVLAVYGDFPKRSEMTHPLHVPYDVSWARFRLEQSVRLVGFIVPKKLKDKENAKSIEKFGKFDFNTFYVVFLDLNHKFYITEKA